MKQTELAISEEDRAAFAIRACCSCWLNARLTVLSVVVVVMVVRLYMGQLLPNHLCPKQLEIGSFQPLRRYF